jgi:hypothetical protein
MYSLYDFEIDFALLFGRVQDVGQESDYAKRNVQSQTVLIPFVLTG